MNTIDLVTLGFLAFALLLQVLAGILAFLCELEPPIVERQQEGATPRKSYSRVPVNEFREENRTLFKWFYIEREIDANFILRLPKFPFRLPRDEVDGMRFLLKRGSLLLLAVAGLIRFAYGEPILSLF